MKKLISILLVIAMAIAIVGCAETIYSEVEVAQENEFLELSEAKDTPVRIGQPGLISGTIVHCSLNDAIEQADIIVDLTITGWLDELTDGDFPKTYFSAKINRTFKGQEYDEIVLPATALSDKDEYVPVRLNFSQEGITSELLAEMVADGTIPKNVTDLDFEFHSLTDISPLASLTELRFLDLRYGDIVDISPLASLTKLKTLQLTENQISDVPDLTSLTKLETLNLSENQISDVSTLTGLKNLKVLLLYDNPLSIEQILTLKKELPDCIIASNAVCTNCEKYYYSNGGFNNIPPKGFKCEPCESYTEVLGESFLCLTCIFFVCKNCKNNGEHCKNCCFGLSWGWKWGCVYPPRSPGHILGNPDIKVSDALEILKYIVGMDNVIEECAVAFDAALIVSVEKPGVSDALEILKEIVGMPNKISG